MRSFSLVALLTLTACNPTLRVYNCDAYYEHGERSEVDAGESGSISHTEDRERVVSELNSAIASERERQEGEKDND